LGLLLELVEGRELAGQVPCGGGVLREREEESRPELGILHRLLAT
jgi:hypothetical protein